MICHRCKENIEVGEPIKHEPINGSGHNWYFHIGCYAAYREEAQQAYCRLEQTAQLARTVH